MRLKQLLVAVAGVVLSTLAVVGVAWAAGATTTVTIVGPDHVYGTIQSSSKSCLGGRTVIVFMQLGSSQSPTTDQKMNTTTSSVQGNKGIWDMGNPGFPKHKLYYAEAKRKIGCKAGFSKTVRF
jgi:hypothetical protein